MDAHGEGKLDTREFFVLREAEVISHHGGGVVEWQQGRVRQRSEEFTSWSTVSCVNMIEPQCRIAAPLGVVLVAEAELLPATRCRTASLASVGPDQHICFVEPALPTTRQEDSTSGQPEKSRSNAPCPRY